MPIIQRALILIFATIALASFGYAQDMPSTINAALYQLNNEGVDTIIVFMPSFNDQLAENERENLTFYVFWQINGKQFYRKHSSAVLNDNTVELDNSKAIKLATEHFYEIENEEILEPYYRQVQKNDTVWIMFPPASFLKDLFLIQLDGLRMIKFMDNNSLDAKEYFGDGIYNIHFTANSALGSAILRKQVRLEVDWLENHKKNSSK